MGPSPPPPPTHLQVGLKTPLHAAASSGSLGIVRLLLEQAGGKATVNAVCAKGTTPLLLAARRGFVEVARCLLAAGAEVDLATVSAVFGAHTHMVTL